MTAATEEAAKAGSAPAEGQLVTVRNRVWVVSDVARSAIAQQSMTGRPQHAVTLVSIEDRAEEPLPGGSAERQRPAVAVGRVADQDHVIPSYLDAAPAGRV
jgi:hypothetical protein